MSLDIAAGSDGIPAEVFKYGVIKLTRKHFCIKEKFGEKKQCPRNFAKATLHTVSGKWNQ